MKTMISEGDRSGVATPSKSEKAHNRLKAVMRRIELIDAEWDRLMPQRRAIAISEARHDLASVVTILMGGDGDT